MKEGLPHGPGTTAEPTATAWAKRRERDGALLSLGDHFVDVAAVAEALLSQVTIRRRLAALDRRESLSDADVARLSVFAGLHDVGKVLHSFQRRLRYGTRASHTAPVGAVLGSAFRPTGSAKRVRRAVWSGLRRERWKSWFGNPSSIKAEKALWDAVLAHHGGLPEPQPVDLSDWLDARSRYEPLQALVGALRALEAMFPAALEEVERHLPASPRFLHAFAGLVTLADWIGSDDSRFQFPCDGAPTGHDRIQFSRRTAVRVMEERWLDPRRARSAVAQVSLAFRDLFPNFAEPRPAQEALLTDPIPPPGQVVVLEAETGSGKTEAALLHFLRLFRAVEVDGLYFALPTRAAAVQIHRRIKRMVQQWFGDGAPPVGLAVPGYLRVDDHEGKRLPESFHVLWDDARFKERHWVVENAKRYLSGAVMVGTVDQALLGGLRARHAQLRSGPMLRLLLVVDEVHASDTYMTELLRNLLDQHRAAGGHTLLMSATLGAQARGPLLARSRPFGGEEAPTVTDAADLPYPSIQRSGGKLMALKRDGQRKRVSLDVLAFDENSTMPSEGLVKRLASAASAGAAVLFIRNTVEDAQRTVEHLEGAGVSLFQCRGVNAPHHGRFAAEDRKRLDDALQRSFKTRDRGFVAVTTQTAEQSLDLCADWLVTDLAPGDVLLQRIGRLHRHQRSRPPGFDGAVATVLSPAPEWFDNRIADDGRTLGRARLGLGGKVYPNLVGLFATRRWLIERGTIEIPAHNRDLVETATNRQGLDEIADAMGQRWRRHVDAVFASGMAEGVAAHTVRLVWEGSIAENRPVRHLQAATRLGLRDRRAEFPPGTPGPFGALVQTIGIPEWMARGIPDDAAPVFETTEAPDQFLWGGRRYRYDRLGLRRSAE